MVALQQHLSQEDSEKIAIGLWPRQCLNLSGDFLVKNKKNFAMTTSVFVLELFCHVETKF